MPIQPCRTGNVSAILDLAHGADLASWIHKFSGGRISPVFRIKTSSRFDSGLVPQNGRGTEAYNGIVPTSSAAPPTARIAVLLRCCHRKVQAGRRSVGRP